MVVKVAPVAPQDRDLALRDYAQSLHQYTRNQWLDARRQAELAAQHHPKNEGSTHSNGAHGVSGFMRKAKPKRS